MCKTILKTIFFYLSICMSLHAENITNINFGDIKIRSDAESLLAEKVIHVSNECAADCSNVKVRWEAIAGVYSKSENSKKYTFFSDVEGIGINIDLNRFDLGSNNEVMVSIAQLRKKYSPGRFSNAKPLLRWYIEKHEGTKVVTINTGVLNVSGSIYSETCYPTQGDLYFTMKPVSIDTIKNISIGEKLNINSELKNIDIICPPNFSSGFSIKFNGDFYTGAPRILNAGNGIGFIAEFVLTGKDITWSGLESYDGVIPDAGKISVPLRVYYTKTEQNVKAGSVYAKGRFTISYR